MKKLVIGLIALTAFSSFAKEGGNGGGAFVCRDSNNKVLSATLLDYYEGAERYNLTMAKHEGSVNNVLDQTIAKIYRALPRDAASRIDSLAKDLQNSMIKKPGITLSRTPDFDIIVQPSSCKNGKISFEQLAYYGKDARLNVSQDIYEKLPLIEKVGLILHEAIYEYARYDWDAPTSTQSRRLVAYLLSTLEVDEYSDDATDLEPRNKDYPYICDYQKLEGDVNEYDSSEYRLYVTRNVQNKRTYGTTLERAFSQINGSGPDFRWDFNYPEGKHVIVCAQFNRIPTFSEENLTEQFIRSPCSEYISITRSCRRNN